MRMPKRYLRCFAEFSGGVWVAYCLDLGMGAQGDSMDEAKRKLEAQINDLTPDEAYQFFRRGAPIWLWARYAYTWAVVKAAHLFGTAPSRRKRFKEPTPKLAVC